MRPVRVGMVNFQNIGTANDGPRVGNLPFVVLALMQFAESCERRLAECRYYRKGISGPFEHLEKICNIGRGE